MIGYLKQIMQFIMISHLQYSVIGLLIIAAFVDGNLRCKNYEYKSLAVVKIYFCKNVPALTEMQRIFFPILI